jgi:glucose/arabinose dehydrogenase
MPTLSTGAHTIELATFVVEGAVTIESSRSAALRILFSGPSAFSVPAMLVVTSERVQLNLTPVADGLHLPSDLAFAADGSIFIAERRGTVRVMKDGTLADDLALDLSDTMTRAEGGLLAIALDPAFGENGFLYALYAVDAPHNGVEFTLARFRYANGVLTDRAVLLDRTTASSSGASGALRIGPDGKLYVALDSDSNGRIAASFATYNGKVLRFNTDATTPHDQPASNPIYSLEHPQPIALDWQPATGTMWVIDRVGIDAGRLSAVSREVPQSRITSRTSYALPAGTGAASAAFYRGTLMPIFKDNLFIAAEMGRQLVRLRFDPENGSRIVSTERLLQDQIGAVRGIAEAPDGALFIATESVLYRLAP